MHRGKRPSGTAGCRQPARARTPRGSSAAARVRWLILECGCRHTAGVQRDAGRHQRARQARIPHAQSDALRTNRRRLPIEAQPFSLQLHACSSPAAPIQPTSLSSTGTLSGTRLPMGTMAASRSSDSCKQRACNPSTWKNHHHHHEQQQQQQQQQQRSRWRHAALPPRQQQGHAQDEASSRAAAQHEPLCPLQLHARACTWQHACGSTAR